MNILKTIKEFINFKIRSKRWSDMEKKKFEADVKAKETGRTHYVIDVDGRPLVMNSNIIKALKKRRLLDKDFFAPMEALYIAKF